MPLLTVYETVDDDADKGEEGHFLELRGQKVYRTVKTHKLEISRLTRELVAMGYEEELSNLLQQAFWLGVQSQPESKK